MFTYIVLTKRITCSIGIIARLRQKFSFDERNTYILLQVVCFCVQQLIKNGLVFWGGKNLPLNIH